MIPLIIVAVLLVLSVVLLLSHRWEIDTETYHYYDENGKYKAYAKNLVGWNTKNCPQEIIDAIKKLRGKEWKDYEKQNMETHRILYYLDCTELPCRIVYKKKIQKTRYWDTDDHPVSIIGGGVGIVACTIALLAMGITAAVAKCEWCVETRKVEITEKIVELENNKQYITTYYTTGVNKDIDISSTNIPAVIKEHNAEVKDLIKSIKTDKINLNNPWCNIWVNPACKNVDVARIEATYINSLT